MNADAHPLVARLDLDRTRGNRRHERLVVRQHPDLTLHRLGHHELGLARPDDLLR